MQNKNILITGANKGIGRELSFGMSAKGANIIPLRKRLLGA
jgi:NAD(P)-dependent dehydrogenase (short-subunit alcohol dehydrogenase family)